MRVQLGPEFLRGKRWFSVMSSASSRRLSGTVSVPSEHSCLASFTFKKHAKTFRFCALNRKLSNLTSGLAEKIPASPKTPSYLGLQLLGFGVVDEEGEGFLPHRFICLVSGLEEDTKVDSEGQKIEEQVSRVTKVFSMIR